MDLKAIWDDSDPALWRRAATDWRGMWAEQQAAQRADGRDGLAEDVGYASVSKLGTLIADWRRLTATALDGDHAAAERVRRAEDFGRMIAARS